MAASTETAKVCLRCGGPIPRGPNYRTKKFCGMACYTATKPFTPEQRAAAFWDKVDKSGGHDACWPWQGALTTHGYGCVQVGHGRVLGAHKVAFELSKITVPSGLQVMHSCDNPRCCNPAHLGVGSRKQNMEDMAAKGRGRKDGKRKLKPDQIREIRALRGKASSGEISEKYGIVQSYVFGIWAGRVWRDV